MAVTPVELAAARLAAAFAEGRPVAPVRDLLGTQDVDAAYAVQQELTRSRMDSGAVVVGRKIGLTSPAVQRQLGVDQPDFGVLFADMDVSSEAEVPSGRLLQPKAEAEIAFVLKEDLADGDLDPAQVRAAVDYAVAALEIVDSRIADWDISLTDTVADNASSGLFVLAEHRLTLDEFEPRETVMRLYADDVLVSEGNGAACLGDPLNALAWLARTARDLGDPLRAGQVVLSGALGPMVPAPPGTRIRAEISSLGEVTAAFSEEEGRMTSPKTSKTKVAIIGSGNIGTDLMIKILRLSDTLEVAAMVGIDPESDGLARAARLKVPTTHEGVEGLIAMEHFDDIEIVFDATSAKAHLANAHRLAPFGKRLIDLTPAAIGPFVVPPVNLDEHLEAGADNLNMVTCGGQATIPMVAAISAVTDVHYAEIVASIASKSAGPGTRANIDEFTETTSHAIENVGGAARGKAIIVLNPAEPPLIMRDTVFCLIGDADHDAIRASVKEMAERVAQYVPGYRLKQEVQFTPIAEGEPVHTLLPEGAGPVTTRVSVFLEVEGAAHYLPAYAGNLDIMTSAALRTAESIARHSTTVTAEASR